MQGRRKNGEVLNRTESWWPLVRDIATFVLGGLILAAQLLKQHPDPALVGAGLALIGATGSGRLQQWAKRTPRAEREEGE